MLTLHLSDTPGGPAIGTYAARATDLEFGNNEHGHAAMTCFITCRMAEAFALYFRPYPLHATVSYQGFKVWEGRVEDKTITPGGISLTGLGYWRAFSDAPYTGLWSATLVAQWKPVLETDISTHNPKMYEIDFQNRIRISLQKNAAYVDQDDIGAAYFSVPDSSQTSIRRFSFDYTYDVPTNWAVQAEAYNGWTSAAVNTITTGGGTATSSLSWDLTATPASRVVVRIYNRTGSTYTYTGESGDKFLRVTNVRVTPSGTTIYSNEIAAALATFVNSLNSTQISAAAGMIESTSTDLKDEVYEDELPADILTRLAQLGDSAGNRWEVGVWNDRVLHFRQRGKYARRLFVDAEDITVESSLDGLYNSVYAIYQEAGGRSLRTSNSTSIPGVALAGVTRRSALRTQTTDSTQAGYHRDVALTDTRYAAPRVSVSFTRAYTATGGLFPLWFIQSGDSIVIRNLPAVNHSAADKIREFRISEMRYNVRARQIQVTPEAPIPALDVLLARQAKGL